MINFVDALKVIHRPDSVYDERIDDYRPLKAYKSPPWIFKLGTYPNWETPPSLMSDLTGNGSNQ